MSSEVIEKVDDVISAAADGEDNNSSIANNNNEGGSKGVSALHDLIAGGVAGSMSVIVGRKFFLLYTAFKSIILRYTYAIYSYSREVHIHTYCVTYLISCAIYQYAKLYHSHINIQIYINRSI